MDIVELAQGNPTDQPRLLEALVKDNYESIELCAAAGELSGQIPCPHIDYGESHEPDHTD